MGGSPSKGADGPKLRQVVGFLLGWNALLWLVVGWLFGPLAPGGWATVIAVGTALLLPVLLLARGLGGRAYPSRFQRVWLLRPFWYGQLFLPFLAAAGLLGALAGAPFGAGAQVGRVAVLAIGVLLVVLAAWGFAGTRRLVVRPLELTFDALPEGLDGIRIVQLSDLHVGPHTPERQLARIAAAVRASDPDLIVLTGDQVDDYPRDVEPLARGLGSLRAPLGVVAVAGNHDVYAGWPAVRRGLERIGWSVLTNEAMAITRNGARLWLVGTGDPAGRSGLGAASGSAAPDLQRALAPVPEDGFVLALAHNPVLWPALVERGVQLTLSGHTHHGQLSLPACGWSLASPFLEHAMGLHRSGSSMLYIHPGTNYWGVPLRIGALPEVTVVTLRPGSGGRRADAG